MDSVIFLSLRHPDLLCCLKVSSTASQYVGSLHMPDAVAVVMQGSLLQQH